MGRAVILSLGLLSEPRLSSNAPSFRGPVFRPDPAKRDALVGPGVLEVQVPSFDFPRLRSGQAAQDRRIRSG